MKRPEGRVSRDRSWGGGVAICDRVSWGNQLALLGWEGIIVERRPLRPLSIVRPFNLIDLWLVRSPRLSVGWYCIFVLYVPCN